jgi:hypothetical protein
MGQKSFGRQDIAQETSVLREGWSSGPLLATQGHWYMKSVKQKGRSCKQRDLGEWASECQAWGVGRGCTVPKASVPSPANQKIQCHLSRLAL